ncbi:GAF domain-containing protein [Aquimarina sp. AD10]|uniref:GAF domain-containing protein n=1 Tax=Aquimarina TaxID=290174 RepID=UPI000E47B889|nr:MULTISPECIES: GAF domain-containing protein [Aquimarina]AXT60249.1 GAF domain-containing protein [Aquimarina sp. AD10]RKN01316.1 GAF domain-containing protein [Aquimarina sp. AD10]
MVNEQSRLQDLEEYHIMDTPPEKELNDLAEIASALCDTPISLISLLDNKRQWFKAVKGLTVKETPIKDAFCRFALHNADEVLVVEDSLLDDRFRENLLVIGDPNIRFYAGAPLKTPNGNVLGTLCIIDRKPRFMSKNQKKALKLLASRVMDFLTTRKIMIQQAHKIEFNRKRLKKLTDQVPGIIFQFEMTPQKEMSFSFVSKGVEQMNSGLNTNEILKNPSVLFNSIYEQDLSLVENSILKSYSNMSLWETEFRVVLSSNSKPLWYKGTAKPESQKNGNVIWYGIIQDISYQKEYEKTIEQISFDISHVLRKPICTMLGLTTLIENEEINEELLKKYSKYIRVVSDELDNFTKTLNETYAKKKKRAYSKSQIN